MPYFVYLLECKDKTLYCGCTNDIKARLEKHNAGKGAKYTRSRLPIKLVYFERKKSKSQALKREAEIKKKIRKQKEELVLTAQKTRKKSNSYFSLRNLENVNQRHQNKFSFSHAKHYNIAELEISAH